MKIRIRLALSFLSLLALLSLSSVASLARTITSRDMHRPQLTRIIKSNREAPGLYKRIRVGGPSVFLLDPQALLAVKRQIQAGHSKFDPALAQLLDEAERAMKVGPLSVTTKSMTSPSRDKHDYTSLARYWWPNPNTPDGLPYVRRDGEVNPEIRKFPDEANLVRMEQATQTLSLAYFFKGDERYAAQAAALLRAWFLDPPTRMNPNMNYAEFIPGINDGRGGGIIQARDFSWIGDSVGLLAGSKAWTEHDQRGMQDWFSQYLTWLLTSECGKSEARATNNHSSWYDAQVASIALFVGKTELATTALQESMSKRIAKQIEPDGRQPLELNRTKSWDYSVFNLQALFRVAALGDRVGIDIWHFQTKDGRSL